MPLLAAEPSLFPESLFSRDDAEAVPNWLVIYTRSRAEKALARSLWHRQIGFFLPLHQQRWRSPSGRVRGCFLPLFPGYLFVHGGNDARLHALETGLVSRCLSVPDEVGLHNDLTRVYRLISSGARLLPEDRLQPGRPVEFVIDPFVGLRGKVIRRGNQLRLIVEVELLQRGVSVEVEDYMIRALKD